MQSYDVHQHLWPEPLVDALRRRTRPPLLRGNVLELAGSARFEVDLGAHVLERRIRALDRDGTDVAVVSLQPTLGLDDADELRAAYHDGVRELVAASGGRLRALAAGTALDGFVGACVPANKLVSALERDTGSAGGASPAPTLFEELERRGQFLFVHPGPAGRREGAPAWWPEVVDYTAQMQAAYAAWLAHGASAHPDLRVVFAILAGGAPVQLERLRSRGVDVRAALHANVFFDVASYGRRALELCLATFGVRQLVYGSDTPVIDPRPTLQALAQFGDAVCSSVRRENPSLLLG